MNFTSEWVNVNAPAEKVFAKATDLKNLGEVMPEQIVNWQADDTHCSFTIKGMTSLKLRVDEKNPSRLMRLVPDGKSPVEFELLFYVKPAGDQASSVMVEVEADLNPMLALMARRPLQNLVDTIAAGLGRWNY
ncbi:MAG: SRPBCC family protein [Bacteroidetes bacterium]|nr:SRPBCC family protein [Bacteroidota bacterium]